MLYAIVSYDDTCETDFVPLKWLTDHSLLSDVSKLIENRSIVQFYWPPWRKPSAVANAKKQCTDAELQWPVYPARILSTAS